MNKLTIIVKNEFYRYFISPLAYVYLIGFLLLNGSFAFYFGHFFERGQADLLPMFIFQPWLYLLFIPGISMRLWAEEFRTKTILQIATLPISVSTLVWGKFLASWLFCALALLLTFPFWIAVNFLGSPDNAVIASGYLGSFILAGCMLAISQTMSALTKNQVIALVLSVIANLFFFLSGLEYVLDIFRGFLSASMVDTIASFSFLTHFETICRGLLELRDIVFFISIILLFNFTTVLAVSFRTAGNARWLKSTRRGSYILVFCFLLAAFSGINLLANSSLRRICIDFTAEGIYTLTPATQTVIANLKSPVTARLYYTPILGRRNPEARLMFDNISLLLRQYAALSDGKISLKIYNPEPLSNTEDRAIAAGLQPLPVIDSNINAYFGLVLSDERGNRQVIPFFPLERRNFAEQDLTEAFYNLGRRKPKLGLLTSLPIDEEIRSNIVTPKWEILNQLERFYEIVPLSNENNNLNDIDVLMIAHPKNLSEQTQNKIRDYSFAGGKILAFFDIAPEALKLTSPLTELLSASDYGSLPELWGFRFFNNAVVADLDNSSMIDATTDYQNNPEFTQDVIQFYLRDQSFNSAAPETRGLQKMLLTSASVFAPLKDAKIEFIPLLTASANSQLMSARAVYDNIHPADILRLFKADNLPKYLAARIKGVEQPFDLIVVGDSDLLYDNFWTKHQTVLERNYAIPVLDNANFVLNALDTLRGEDTLLSLRGKNYISRPFTGVEAARIEAARNFKIREKEIFDNLARAKDGMSEILSKRQFENRETFTSDELAAIASIRKRIDAERRELFTIRNDLNNDIEKLKSQTKFATVYAIPLVLLIILLVPLLKKHGSNTSAEPLLNRRIIIIGSAALALLLAGIVSTTHQPDTQNLDNEDWPLFKNLAEQINQVQTITLQNHNHKLVFTKEANGLWQLKGYPHYLVYQNRIRSFLSALLEATYYEKKTAGLKNLQAFGLAPIENETSTAVQVRLTDHNATDILNFNIGYYDLDLGRGSRGAYIRFDNSFQVWLAQADFIDLSLDPLTWTYSSLWNLQFGRLVAVNENTDPEFIANTAKELLNIHFQEALSVPANAEPAYTLKLAAENKLNITLHFYAQDNAYLVVYDFVDISSSKLLQNFAACAKGMAYKISAADMEKLINVRPIDRSPGQPS